MDRTLSLEDAGRAVDVQTGDVIVLRLVRRPGTGHAWRLTPTTAPLAVTLLEPPHDEPVGGNAPGSATEQVFRFRVEHAGDTALALELVRPWEDAPPVESFRVALRISRR